MTEKPILFSASMVQAILAGRKTQTRRVVKPQPEWQERQGLVVPGWSWEHGGVKLNGWPDRKRFAGELVDKCPYGKPGDILWVRETWRPEELKESGPDGPEGLDGTRYKADGAFRSIENSREASDLFGEARYKFLKSGHEWRPSIFMPRWASRLTLRVTGVRVERVKDISEADARAEGVTAWVFVPEFKKLWDAINAKLGYSWESNPWVWVVEFEVQQ